MSLRLQQTPGVFPHPNSGGIRLSDISVPRTLQPGEEVDVSVEVEVSASPTLSLQPDDDCLTGGFLGPGSRQGFRMVVSAALDGSADSVTYCHPASGLAAGPNYARSGFTITAPTTPGTYDLEIDVEGADTGQRMARQFVQIEVPGQSPQPSPEPEPGDGGDGGGVGLGDLPSAPDLPLFQRLVRFIRGLIADGTAYLRGLLEKATTRESLAIIGVAVAVAAVLFRTAGELTPFAIAERVVGLVTPS